MLGSARRSLPPYPLSSLPLSDYMYLPFFLTIDPPFFFLFLPDWTMFFLLLAITFHVTFETWAIRFPVQGLVDNSRTLRRRAELEVVDEKDLSYLTNITLGGQTVTVLLDTGR
jgi:hypothetical protein